MPKNFIRLALASALLALAAFANAQTASEFFDLGVRAYDRGDFEAAAENFAKSAELEPGAPAYHNLGNAYFKLSKPGLARLNYERARYLAPRAPETGANLARITRESGETPRNGISDAVFGEFSNSEWTWGAIACAWGAIVCFAVVPPFVKRARVAKIFGSLFALGLAVSVLGCAYWSKVANTAIAVSPDVLLGISPAANAPSSHAMGEAKSARIAEEKGNYVLAEFPAGKYGWASKNMLEPIWPPRKSGGKSE